MVSTSSQASGLAFQRAPDHVRPTWPDPGVPQQIHLDVMVDDPSAARTAVLAFGATELADDGVFADPAGHPFCLIRRPTWAAPLSDQAAGPAQQGDSVVEPSPRPLAEKALRPACNSAPTSTTAAPATAECHGRVAASSRHPARPSRATGRADRPRVSAEAFARA